MTTSVMTKDSCVFVAARRTAIGSFQGVFSDLPAPQLGARALRACLDTVGGGVGEVLGEVLMGCVLSAGLGQAPTRQAARAAEIDDSIGAVTINKVCGSGLRALIAACDAVASGREQCMLAGGMESMSNAPYLLPKARRGLRIGHGLLQDHMLYDGLEDAYGQRCSMGLLAERTAEEVDITREEMDVFAVRSIEQARRANGDGSFATEIAAVEVPARLRGDEVRVVIRDEQPFKAIPEKIPFLNSAFLDGGRITAANASSISDGAAALMVVRASLAEERGWPILARVVASAAHAREPSRFTLAPIEALRKLSRGCGWDLGEVDLFEINEAFAVVVLAVQRALGLPLEKINVNGGACALGHPIGASGARIVVTLIHALRARGLARGMAVLCIGGGEALAMAVEVPDGSG